MKKALMMLTLGIGVSAVVAEQVPVEVQQLIDSAMSGKNPNMVSFNTDAPHMGFGSGTKLSDVQAGEPIHLYWFDTDSIRKLDENAPVSSVIKPIDEWAVPLLLKGESKLLLEILKNPKNGKWHVSGYGMSGYAERWEKICQIWPKSAGFHPMFIGLFFGTDFYFHISEKGDKNLTSFGHLSRHKVNLDSLYTNLEPSSGALKKIKSYLPPPSAGGR